MSNLAVVYSPHTFNKLILREASGAKMDSQSGKLFTNSAKQFSEQFEGLPGHVPVEQGFFFEANRARKFTRTFGKIFVAQFLCGTISVPKSNFLRNNFVSQHMICDFPCLGLGKLSCNEHGVMFCQDQFSTPNPQVCQFYFLSLVQKEKSLLRKPDFPC